MLSPVERRWLGVCFALALLLRMLILSQGLDLLDQRFVPDDTFYTLAISGHAAAGRGLSVDGTGTTSGFQPLITLLQLPLFYLLDDRDSIAMAAVGITAVIGACSLIPMGLLMTRLREPRAAVLSMVLLALAPGVVSNDLNGLETSLSGLILLCLILQLAAYEADPRRHRLLLLGLLSALSLLARIDNALVLVVMGFYLLARHGLTPALITAASALVVISPWWAYLLHVSGSILPESGQALRVFLRHSLLKDTPVNLLAAGLVPYKIAELFASLVPGRSDLALAQRLLLLFSTVFAIRHVIMKRLTPHPLLWVLLLSGMAFVLFYALYLPAIWFYERYFHALYLFLIVTSALWLAQWKRHHQIILGFMLIGCVASFPYYFSQVSNGKFLRLRGPRGYRAMAKAQLARLPVGARVAAMQSAALNYYAERGITVLNLDGVVNSAASSALDEGQLWAYTRGQGVEYFIDWPENFQLFLDAAGEFDSSCVRRTHTTVHGAFNSVVYDLRECYNGVAANGYRVPRAAAARPARSIDLTRRFPAHPG